MILAQAYPRFAFDLDGVVWRGERAIEGAPETIRALRDAGKRVCFVTNNSGRTPVEVAKQLAAIGAGGDVAEVVTSAEATARLLERDVPGLRGRLAMVIGGPGLREAVEATGVRIASAEDASDASIVIVGVDQRLTYQTLARATNAIRAGAMFYASNEDATLPVADGFVPGAGAIVAAIRTATDVAPRVAGKPQAAIMELAAQRLGGEPILAIGDRLDTDVGAARAVGWPIALVMTGVTTVADLAVSDMWPDYLLTSVADLLADRPHPHVRHAAGPDLPLIAHMLHSGGLRSGAARERTGRTVVAEVGRTPIATAAWEQVGDDALLRSVAVSTDARGSGVGRFVVAGALRRAAQAGMRDVYLGTEGASDFFAACGFRAVDRDTLPHLIAEHKQLQTECSSDATVMHLRLTPTAEVRPGAVGTP